MTCRGLSPLQEQLSPPRPPSPPSPQPQECYRLALERRLAELEEKGLVQILRGPDGDVAIEIVPVVIETPAAPVISGEATTATDTTATCTGTVGARGCPLPGGDTWRQGGVGSKALGTETEAGVWECARGLGEMRWQRERGGGTMPCCVTISPTSSFPCRCSGSGSSPTSPTSTCCPPAPTPSTPPTFAGG